MAALTNAVTPETAPRAGRRSYPLKSGDTFYEGGLMGVDADGVLVPWNDAATTICFVGLLLSQEPATGNENSETGTNHGWVDESGSILRNVSVTGATDQTDVYDAVYCATDNWGDLKLAANTNTKKIGYIDKLNPDGTYDVKLLTPIEYLEAA